jgi:hypothetical protein
VGSFAIEMSNPGKMYSWGIADRTALYGAWSAPAQLSSPNVTALATLHNLGTSISCYRIRKPFSLPSRIDSGANLGAGVVLCSFNTGLITQHKRLEFYFDLSVWALTSNLYSNLWIQFVTHGVYFGQRRMYLSVQVRDFFSDTAQWSEFEMKESGS